MRRKVLACVVSLVMVFSMTSAAALTAFADQLAAGSFFTQAAGNKVVYDDVYGVMGTESGDYALMMKTVTYEAQYHNFENYPYYAQTTDLVKSDGTISVHGIQMLNPDHQQMLVDEFDVGPATDYQIGQLGLYKTDIEAGFVKVTKRSTNKVGLLKLDGTELVPCAYDSLTMTPVGDLLGVTITSGTANVSMMDTTGNVKGSFSFAAAQPQQRQYVYAEYYGDYVVIGVSVDGESYQAFAKKAGSQYEQVADVERAINGAAKEWVAVVKTDGNVYYCKTGKEDVKLCPDEGFDNSWIEGNRITLVDWDSDKQVHYALDGTKINVAEDEWMLWLGNSFIKWVNDEATGEGYYAVFDFTGKELARLDCDQVSGLGSLEYFTTMEGSRYEYVEAIDDWALVEGHICIYDSTGKFYKNLGEVKGYRLNTEKRYDSTIGESVIVGYVLPADCSLTGKEVYYDAEFNVVDSLPASEEMVMGSSQLKLADGTNVNIERVATMDSASGLVTASVSVKDDAGNDIVRGGKTLAISPHGNFWTWNSVKHGNADVWWAKDASGKYGAIDSAGNTVIDFKYEAAYDAGNDNTDYALVLENGEWKFIKVANSGIGEVTPVKDPASDPETIGKDVSDVQRLEGDNAFGTMSSIVDKGNFPVGGTVVLATFDGYWDALTAAGVAGLSEAPVLMTYGGQLSDATEAQLKKLRPKRIVVCGGTAVVSKATADAAAKAAGGATVVRAAGPTATGTAVEIYKVVDKEKLGKWADTAFICTNDGYWDALAAAPISYAEHMPIFLTEFSSDISDNTIKAMVDGGIKQVYIVGGVVAIEPKVEKKIEDAGIEVVDRLAGNTAIETSEAVAEFGITRGLSANNMGVATIGGYWDALSGAALCGRERSVLVLVNDSTSHSITGFIKDHAAQIKDVYVFGGPAAVDKGTESAVIAAAK